MRYPGLAALLVLGACASGPEVRVEYDRAAQFEAYRSFAFQSPLGTESAGFEGGALSRYLRAATRRELEARGLRYDEAAPDLRVNFGAEFARKTSATMAAPPGGYYAYRYGYYSTWNGYPSAQGVPYTQGTLNIDIVEVARKQLVWEGVVSGAVTEKALAELQPAVDRAVGAAFARYPRGSR